MMRQMLKEGLRVFCIMGTGDVIAQTIVEERELRKLNIQRTVKFASLGLFFVGPALRVWYDFLDGAVPKNQPTLKRGIKKMLIDQLCFAPVITLIVTSIVYTINGESRERIKERIQTEYPEIMLRNYMLWPATQMVNFTLVPMNYQVVFAQLIGVLWNTYLSMVIMN